MGCEDTIDKDPISDRQESRAAFVPLRFGGCLLEVVLPAPYRLLLTREGKIGNVTAKEHFFIRSEWEFSGRNRSITGPCLMVTP